MESTSQGSDVIALNMLGAPVIVLNSWEACKELIENRSLIYASRSVMRFNLNQIHEFNRILFRPSFTMMNE